MAEPWSSSSRPGHEATAPQPRHALMHAQVHAQVPVQHCHIQNHNRSPNLTLNHVLRKNSTMKQSCMVILVSHRSITWQTVALVVLNAICLGQQATLIVGIQMRRPAVVYLSKRPQMSTTMASWQRIRKLVFAPKVVLSAVGVGLRMIL